MRRTARALVLAVAVLVGVAVVAALALRAYAGARLARAQTAFEAEVGSLDRSTYVPAPVEGDQRAGAWLLEGARLVTLEDAQAETLSRRARALGSAWEEDEEARVLAILDQQRPALEGLRRATGLERSSFGIDYAALPWDLPDFLPLLRASRLLAVECDLGLHRGEIDGAIDSLHLIERMVAALRSESLLLTSLVANPIERTYLDALEVVLAHVPDTGRLDRLAEDLDHLDRVALPYSRALLHESVLMHGWLAAMYGAVPEEPNLRATTWRERTITRLARAAGTYRLVRAMHLEIAARVLARLDRPLAGLDRENFERDVLRIPSWPPSAGVLLQMTANTFEIIQLHRDQATRSARRLAAAALELRRARITGSSYPEALPDLPTSLYTGEAATYHRLEDGSVEIAFPESERTLEQLLEETYPSSPESSGARWTPNLRWRLPA